MHGSARTAAPRERHGTVEQRDYAGTRQNQQWRAAKEKKKKKARRPPAGHAPDLAVEDRYLDIIMAI